MKCEEFMNLFLKLDNGEKPSAELAAHLKSCAVCAKEAAAFSRLMAFQAARGNIAPDRDLAAAVMFRITQIETEENLEVASPVSMLNWIGTGIFILLGMFLIPFSTSLPELENVPGLNLALSLVLGSAITVYATFFICSHIRTLSRFLRLH
jgi:hypothetical protein